MKKYIEQIFYEGLGFTLYSPIEEKIVKIKNIRIKNIFIKIHKILYFIFALSLAIIILYYKL